MKREEESRRMEGKEENSGGGVGWRVMRRIEGEGNE
jgi:hypothetical protein